MTSVHVERSPLPGASVVIIGGGLIGCSIALELRRRQAKVTVVERNPGPGQGSTSASSAIVRFHYSTDAGTALAYEGMHYWKNWHDHLGIIPDDGFAKLVTTGMVGLADETRHADRCKPILDRLGVPNEWWDDDELARRLPYLDVRSFWPPRRPDDARFYDEPTSRIRGALFEPEAGYVTDPMLAARNLHDAAESEGVTFRFSSTVVGILTNQDRVDGVSLEDGTTIPAAIVVNAAGPHSSVINTLAGVAESMNVGTRPLRQEVHVMAGPGREPGTPVPSLGDGDSGFYYRDDGHGNLLIGSLEPDCDPLEWLDDADEFSQAFGDQWDAQTMRVARRVPSLGVPHERRGTVGIYDASDDWIPIYDRTDLDGFYVAIGTSGNQFKNGGVVGHLIAELIASVENGHDHDADPLVMIGPHTGLAIDTGAFSRNRVANADSSMSVRG